MASRNNNSSLPYRRNEGDREIIRTLVQDLIDKRRVQESTSPYASPVHLVKKGTKFRLTIDYHKLNEVIVRQVWPMPLIDDLLTSFHGAKYFTTIDLEAAFYQINLKKDSREVITQDGLYEFNILPMGLGNSPAVMQRLMDTVLRGMGKFARGYMDDIIIFSNTFDEHCKHLRIVLHKLRELTVARSSDNY
jgi:hypothetical protein